MLDVTPAIAIPDSEIEITAVRAQGAGGQNVNKVASAAHLRFDIPASSLPEPIKQRMLSLSDRRITAEGVLVVKAQRFRTLEKNVEDARHRLAELVRKAEAPPKKRVATRPPKSSREKRLKEKTKRSEVKQLRGKIL